MMASVRVGLGCRDGHEWEGHVRMNLISGQPADLETARPACPHVLRRGDEDRGVPDQVCGLDPILMWPTDATEAQLVQMADQARA